MYIGKTSRADKRPESLPSFSFDIAFIWRINIFACLDRFYSNEIFTWISIIRDVLITIEYVQALGARKNLKI